ncbi:MAG TPA: hypothetical protein VNT99_11990 [Methylomirabilota bacterium]|nr:hypothetical protein [Methylomirabilota bacterium]
MNDEEQKNLWQGLRCLWQEQKPSADPTLTADEQIAAMRKKMAHLHQRLNKTDFVFLTLEAVIAVVFTIYVFTTPYFVTRIGYLILIGGGLFASWKTFRRRRSKPQPIADAPVMEWLKYDLVTVRQHAEESRTLLWWYLLPFLVGMGVSTWGMPVELMAKIGLSVITVLIAGVTYWLNQRVRRNQWLPMQQELEALEALLQMESQLGTVEEHPSAISAQAQDANLPSAAKLSRSKNPSDQFAIKPPPPNKKTTMRNITLLACSFCAGFLLCYGLLHRSLVSKRPDQTPTAHVTSQADRNTQRCFDTLLAALKADDYDHYISVADDTFRRAITPDAFHSFSQRLAPLMQRGCTPTYLGQLRQNGAQVSLWRLAFADGDYEFLARMSMSQDRVTGFLITPAFQ